MAYKKRIAKNAKLVKKVADRLKLFANDPSDVMLKDHPLRGSKRELRAFWVTGDIRIVYTWVEHNRVLLLDVGGHNQVY
jgi:toxin HigB-1